MTRAAEAIPFVPRVRNGTVYRVDEESGTTYRNARVNHFPKINHIFRAIVFRKFTRSHNTTDQFIRKFEIFPIVE